MTFDQALSFYFTRILDLTTYLSVFFISCGLVIYLFPKIITKKEILKLAIVFVTSYVVLATIPSLFFALSSVVSIPLLYSLAYPILIVVFALIFSKGDFVHRFIKISILVASIIVTAVLSKNTGILMGEIQNAYILVSLARSLPYIFFVAICFLMMKIDINHYRNLSKEMIIIISILSVLLIGAGIVEHALDIHEITVNVLLSLLDVVLLAILALTYYAAYKNVENRHRITNLEVQKTLGDAEKMSVEINQINLEELEKLRHDIKNQLSYVDVLLKQNKTSEAIEYISEYLDKNSNVLNSFSCSNNVINSIINLELTKAKIKKIKIDVKVVVPPLLPFDDTDLVSLLTNTIDNALENYYSETNEPIVVRIIKQNDFIRFFVSNPVDISKVNHHSLTTTRKVGRGHGYGTKIVKNIASTYNGYVDYNVENNQFVCDIVLNLDYQNEKSK